MLDISLDRANQLYEWGWRLSAIGAMATMIGIAILWIGTRVRDRDSETQMADLNLEAATARERAGKLEERAAGLEHDAAQARLETERLKGVVAWRAIPADVAEKLRSALSIRHGYVNLRYTDGDPESLFFAIQISRVLANAGWQVAPGALKPTNVLIFGIRLPDGNGDDANALRKAFHDANIPFSTDAVPQDGNAFSIAKILGAPILFIGLRTPPVLQ
jgi:hypothetical protein